MKRLILSSLIGLMTTFGAFGVDSDTRNGLEQCVDNFLNDEETINLINNGYTTDGATWSGLSDLIKDLPTLEAQQAAIVSTPIPEGYTSDYFKDSRSTFARLYAALFLKHVATMCPEYFIALSERFANDKADGSVRLHLFYKWDGEKIQIITKNEYDNITERENRFIGALTLESITHHLSSNYYFLALPKDTANIGEWLKYETGLEKLQPLKEGDCGGMWEMKNSTNTTDNFVIDGINFINMHKSFPGLIIKYDPNTIPIVRDDNYGYTAINARDYHIQQAYTQGNAISTAKDIATQLNNRGCDDMELYIATTDSPEGIVTKTIQDKLFKQEVETHTQQSKMTGWGITASVTGSVAVAGGIAWGVTSMIESYYNTKAAAAATKTLGKTLLKTATKAKLGKIIARGVSLGSGAITLGVFALGGFALKETFDGLTKDLQPVEIQTYDQLYIMYKTPMNTASQKIKALPRLESSAITIGNTTLAGNGTGNGHDTHTGQQQKNQEETYWERRKEEARQISDW